MKCDCEYKKDNLEYTCTVRTKLGGEIYELYIFLERKKEKKQKQNQQKKEKQYKLNKFFN